MLVVLKLASGLFLSNLMKNSNYLIGNELKNKTAFSKGAYFGAFSFLINW